MLDEINTRHLENWTLDDLTNKYTQPYNLNVSKVTCVTLMHNNCKWWQKLILLCFLVVNRVVFVMNMYAIGWMELNGRGNEITEWIGQAFELKT